MVLLAVPWGPANQIPIPVSPLCAPDIGPASPNSRIHKAGPGWDEVVTDESEASDGNASEQKVWTEVSQGRYFTHGGACVGGAGRKI